MCRAKGSCDGKGSAKGGEIGTREREEGRVSVACPFAAGDSVSATLLPFNPSYAFPPADFRVGVT